MHHLLHSFNLMRVIKTQWLLAASLQLDIVLAVMRWSRPSRWHQITPLLFCFSPGSNVLLAPAEGRRPSASLWDGLYWRGKPAENILQCTFFHPAIWFKRTVARFKRVSVSVLSWRWLVLDQTFTQPSWRPCSPQASSYRRRASWSGFR